MPHDFFGKKLPFVNFIACYHWHTESGIILELCYPKAADVPRRDASSHNSMLQNPCFNNIKPYISSEPHWSFINSIFFRHTGQGLESGASLKAATLSALLFQIYLFNIELIWGSEQCRYIFAYASFLHLPYKNMTKLVTKNSSIENQYITKILLGMKRSIQKLYFFNANASKVHRYVPFPAWHDGGFLFNCLLIFKRIVKKTKEEARDQYMIINDE